MFEVLAIRTVRWINGSFVRGSISSGNSTSTSVISLPLSPHPIYTTIWVSDHLARVCSETVFPVPNPPGIIAVPPLVTGNMQSKTLCPVTRGRTGSSFFATGRGIRTGQNCIMVSRTELSRTQTTSSTKKAPLRTSVTVPETFGGTRTRCSNWNSATVPMISPGERRSPVFTAGTNSHFFVRSRPGAVIPLPMKSPLFLRSSGSGRWTPS